MPHQEIILNDGIKNVMFTHANFRTEKERYKVEFIRFMFEPKTEYTSAKIIIESTDCQIMIRSTINVECTINKKITLYVDRKVLKETLENNDYPMFKISLNEKTLTIYSKTKSQSIDMQHSEYELFPMIDIFYRIQAKKGYNVRFDIRKEYLLDIAKQYTKKMKSHNGKDLPIMNITCNDKRLRLKTVSNNIKNIANEQEIKGKIAIETKDFSVNINPKNIYVLQHMQQTVTVEIIDGDEVLRVYDKYSDILIASVDPSYYLPEK